MKELWLERRHARQRQREEADRDLVLAWQVIRIKVKTENDKRLPDLKTLLRRDGPRPPLGGQGLLAAMADLSDRYGIPLRKRKRKASDGC